MARYPTLFVGHGSPMLALQNNALTEAMASMGKLLIERHGEPKAILAISAHWLTQGTCTNDTEHPTQIYDMYGFPPELYEVKYPVAGSPALVEQLKARLGDKLLVNNAWGIDHGTWTVLKHMFPKANIPTVQLSLNVAFWPQEHYRLGEQLAALREEGVLILGSGNIVHNLRRIDYNDTNGAPWAHEFLTAAHYAIMKRQDRTLQAYENLPKHELAIPTPDHYFPLLYVLGASQGELPSVFNHQIVLGSLAMSSYVFGLDAS